MVDRNKHEFKVFRTPQLSHGKYILNMLQYTFLSLAYMNKNWPKKATFKLHVNDYLVTDNCTVYHEYLERIDCQNIYLL